VGMISVGKTLVSFDSGNNIKVSHNRLCHRRRGVCADLV
jgi:hypothetical protein